MCFSTSKFNKGAFFFLRRVVVRRLRVVVVRRLRLTIEKVHVWHILAKQPACYNVLMKILNRIFLGIITCITLMILLAPLHWFFELWTHYLHYLFLLTLVSSFFFIMKNQIRLGIGVLVFTMILSLPIAPYFPHKSSTAGELKILASNVYYQNTQIDDFFKKIDILKPEIFIIHEASDMWQRMERPPGIKFMSQTSTSGPTGILIGSSLQGSFREVPIGPQMALEFKTKHFRILAVHPLPALNAKWATHFKESYEDLIAYSNNHQDLPLMLVGDFNAAPWSPPIQNLLNTGLADARRGYGLKATWHSTNPFFQLPIDHALLTSEWTTKNFDTIPVEGSDHKAIWIELDLD